MLPLMLLMLLFLFEVLCAAWTEPEPPEAFAQPKLQGRRAQQWIYMTVSASERRDFASRRDYVFLRFVSSGNYQAQSNTMSIAYAIIYYMLLTAGIVFEAGKQLSPLAMAARWC